MRVVAEGRMLPKLRRIRSFMKVRFECETCKKKCWQGELWRLGSGVDAPFLCSETCGKIALTAVETATGS